VAHQFGKNNLVRQNQLELKGSWRQKNQKTQEVSALGFTLGQGKEYYCLEKRGLGGD
jgi:hypothetical protein